MERMLRAWWIVLTLSLLVAIAVPTLWAELDRNYAITKTIRDIQLIEECLDRFKASSGSYPTQQQGLSTLIGEQLRRLPKDRWGNDYVNAFDASGRPNVYSKGMNGADEGGLGDDIVSGPKAYRCEDYEAYCTRPTDVVAWSAVSLALASFLVGLVRGVMHL